MTPSTDRLPTAWYNGTRLAPSEVAANPELSTIMYPYGGRPPRIRPSISACAAMALRTRALMRFRSPLLIPPNTLIARSWASLAGSMGPPTYDDGVELAVRVLQVGEQGSRLGAALPGDRAGLVDVEEVADDYFAAHLDEGARAG